MKTLRGGRLWEAARHLGTALAGLIEGHCSTASSIAAEVALKRGLDNLQNLSEWLFRNRQRALAVARREYVNYCLRLYRKIARAQRLGVGA
jgi:hypothetical protein